MKEAVELLCQKLVQTESTTGKSINAAIVLNEFLESYGYKPELNEYKSGEANVLTKIGPKNAETFLVSGHLDTVPIGDPNAWDHPPFSGKILDGELWGRGSVDMKGGTACLAGVMIELLEKESELKQQVIFAATAEEETGLQGAKQFVKEGVITNLSHILISEPTGLVPKIMEKGIVWFNIYAKGKQAHASRPDLGHNAIEGLAKMFPEIHKILPVLCLPDLGRTSFNPGLIKGGSAPNVVPEKAMATCDIRTTPGVKNNDILASIEKLLESFSSGVKFEMEVLENTPAILSPNNAFAELLAKQTLKYTGNEPQLSGVHYATDGAIFMEAVDHKVPFIIFGPGSTELLHQTNERLNLNELDISRKVIRDAIFKELT